MIEMLLLNIQMIRIIFMKILKNTIQKKNKLLIRGRKLTISLVFIAQSYFAGVEKIKLYSTHYFVIKISNKWEL